MEKLDVERVSWEDTAKAFMSRYTTDGIVFYWYMIYVMCDFLKLIEIKFVLNINSCYTL